MAQLMFKGLKVLDCSSFIAAPAAATILSDFGADVIKIEPPGAGDPYRAVPSLPTMPQASENLAFGIITDHSLPSAWGCANALLVRVESFGDVSGPASTECRGWIDTTE